MKRCALASNSVVFHRGRGYGRRIGSSLYSASYSSGGSSLRAVNSWMISGRALGSRAMLAQRKR